jgi:glycosyltransferase involved in cell wall biosynthesis
MAQGLGGSMPRLVIVGRRGWENEMVVDLLERSQSISPFMTEYSSLADAKMSGLLRRARALLMPSFAEGFGLPVAEAIAAGTPVICSDLAAHREAGQGVPEYLDPVDGAAWEAVIRDYACPASPMRAAQMERMRLFVPPGWDSHVRGALDFLDHVAMLPARHVVEENPFLPRPKTTDARTQSVAIARVASRV